VANRKNCSFLKRNYSWFLFQLWVKPFKKRVWICITNVCDLKTHPVKKKVFDAHNLSKRNLLNSLRTFRISGWRRDMTWSVVGEYPQLAPSMARIQPVNWFAHLVVINEVSFPIFCLRLTCKSTSKLYKEYTFHNGVLIPKANQKFYNPAWKNEK